MNKKIHLALSSLSILLSGCLFDSKVTAPETYSASGELTDTVYPSNSTPNRTVILYRPLLDPSLGKNGSSSLETFPPVFVKEGTRFNSGDSIVRTANGDVVKYVLTQQYFGSWNPRHEFEWNYFLLKTNFLFSASIPDTAGLNDSTKALYNGIYLKDTHTLYFDSASSAPVVAQITTSTKNAKIGISVKQLHGTDTLVLLNVVENSPAGHAGLVKGMILLAINDSAVVGDSSIIRFQKFIAGDSGGSVTLTVLNQGNVSKFTMKREPVEFPTVLIDSLSPNVGYISISGFTPQTIGDNSTATEFHGALIATQKYPATILDLRDNPGGSVDIAFNMCDEILPSGTIIIREHQRHFDENLHATLGADFVVRASNNGIGELTNTGAKKKYLVLTNRKSASASEIMLTALKEGMGAVQMGTLSYGKGIGQRMLPTPGHGLALVTFLKFTTASGLDYNLKGVVPDYFDTSSTDTLLMHAADRAEKILGTSPLAKISEKGALQRFENENGKLAERAALIEWNRRQRIRQPDLEKTEFPF